MKKKQLYVVFSLCLLGFSPVIYGEKTDESQPPAKPPSYERTLKMFRLVHSDYEDIQVLAGEFLSAKGTMRYVKGRNAVVVIDFPDNIAKIKTVIDTLEGHKPPVNIRIKVTFDDVQNSGHAGWGVETRGPVIVENGKVKKVTVDAHAGKSEKTTSSQTSQEILTGDGKPARIWVGETVREPQWVFEYGYRRAWWSGDYVEYNFGASLYVRPKQLNNGLIQVDVYPRLTSRTGKRLRVDVKELTVSVLARDGQTVAIGGMDEKTCEAYSKIFGRGKIFNGKSLSITLTPSIEKVGESRKPGTPGHVKRPYRRAP